MIIRQAGPAGVTRPFHPDLGENDPAKQIAHALEHIALVLSALDHNIEAIANKAIPTR